MIRNTYKGKFIVFDSLDGAGDSTQVKLLADSFREKKEEVHITKEPTNGLIGGIIKEQLNYKWESSVECLQLLFTADRAHHLEKEIIPLLKKGVNVISDRYLFSTIAYGAVKTDFDWLIEINRLFLAPDITFFLKTSAQTCMKRITKRGGSTTLYEKEKYLEKVWLNYQEIANRFQGIHIIDGERNIEDIAQEIKGIVNP